MLTVKVFIVEGSWIERFFSSVKIPKLGAESYNFINVKPTWIISGNQSAADFVVHVVLWSAHCLFDGVFCIQLSSIPGLEDVKFEVSSADVNSVTNGPVAQAATDQQTAGSPQPGVSNAA